MHRREFLQRGGALMLAGAVAPALWGDVAQAARAQDRTLVIIQLQGGNDGLNAVVPYRDERYYKLRPNIAVARDTVYPLDGHMGLHPSLARLYPHYDQGNIAIIQGVGYPNRTRSHFISTDIWQSARIPANRKEGWLGRFAEASHPQASSPVEQMAYGTLLPMALLSDHQPCDCIDHLSQFEIQSITRNAGDQQRHLEALRAMYRGRGRGDMERVRHITEAALDSVGMMRRVARRIDTPVRYPETPFAQFLKMAAAMVAEKMGPRVFHAGIGGFDTHSKQRKAHDRVLRVLGDGVAAFLQDVQVRGIDTEVLVATYSEFGRRAKENGSEGTDHGLGAPQFVMGTNVRGGLHGDYPDLTDLVDGDIRFTLDFRRLYATILEDWMRTPSASILGGRFETLPLLT